MVEISPSRVTRWFGRFAERHGGVRATEVVGDTITVVALDGATAAVTAAVAPLGLPEGTVPGLSVDGLVAHLLTPRRIGLLLVRLGGHSIGVAQAGRVLVATTDRALGHGRSKAGGWSQQRFARRRAGQATRSLRALDVLREDRRLAGVFAIAGPRVLDVPEPRRAVLDEAAVRACSAEILVTEP